MNAHIHRMLVPLAIAATLTVGACDPDDSDPNDGGQFGEETGAGCTVVAEIPVALDDTTDSGIIAQELIDLAEGDHASVVSWADGSSAALLASVSDPTNARVLEYDYVADGRGAEPAIYCPDVLVVDVTLALVTDDGQLDEALAATLQMAEDDTASIKLELDALSGSFDVTDYTFESFDSVWADLSVVFDTDGMSGDISGYGESSSGSGPDSTVSLSRFEIATF